MNSKEKSVLTAGILSVGALVFVALSVYPFQFGTMESPVFAGLLVGLGIVELVLDDTSF
jgi:hypothetical protein